MIASVLMCGMEAECSDGSRTVNGEKVIKNIFYEKLFYVYISFTLYPACSGVRGNLYMTLTFEVQLYSPILLKVPYIYISIFIYIFEVDCHFNYFFVSLCA